MRKWICIMLIGMILVTVAGAALADSPAEPTNGKKEARFSAKGCIRAPDPISVLAPMGGQVEDFQWAVGDVAEAGAPVVSIRPTQVLAAGDGIVRSLQARSGDRAEDVIRQYGALCYIERQDVWCIDATTSGAYSDPDNRDVRIGQRVRVQHGTGDDKVRGEASVIGRDGKNITLEIERGDFDIEDSVKLYLETSKDNASKDQVGSGDIVRAPAIPATGEGVLARVLVEEGQVVSRGQPLFWLDTSDARYGGDASAEAEAAARFPVDGLVAELLVRPGEFVRQGQALMTVTPTSALEATLEVDELDIAGVRVGDTVRARVDAYPEERTGTVTEIRRIGQTVLDTTKFPVKVELSPGDDLMIGMHVTGYWD